MTNASTKSALLFSSLNYSVQDEGPIIIAYHLKTPENMGHIIRLAANFACKRVVFVGDQGAVRESKIKKVGGAAVGQVEWGFASDDEWLQQLDEGYQIIAVETSKDSINCTQAKLPSKTAFLLGNEIYGLPDELIKQCDASIHIPMPGIIKSMNVSHACTVALYEWVRQFLR
jgi:tRNA G18 (ribose-2'-O)-methylase SpoU